jgi:hypothetical protein
MLVPLLNIQLSNAMYRLITVIIHVLHEPGHELLGEQGGGSCNVQHYS